MLFLLRLLHVVVGAFWVGTVLFVALFLMPGLRAVGPGAAPLMTHLVQARRLPIVLLTSAWITLLSGAALAWHDAGPLGFRWFSVGPGRVFGIGAVLAFVATMVGMLVNAPTARRIGMISGRAQAAGRPPSAEEQQELGRLQARMTKASNVAAVLLVLALMAMAVARYVP
jgi:uncharacterized membrane protein